MLDGGGWAKQLWQQSLRRSGEEAARNREIFQRRSWLHLEIGSSARQRGNGSGDLGLKRWAWRGEWTQCGGHLPLRGALRARALRRAARGIGMMETFVKCGRKKILTGRFLDVLRCAPERSKAKRKGYGMRDR
jgi:hypothetical protein